METAIVVRVTEVSVDVRMHGRYISDANLARHIDIADLDIGDVVLVSESSGKFYITAIVSSIAVDESERGSAWVPRAPVSLTSTQVGSVAVLTWDWGDTVSRYSRLKNYELDVRIAGGEWGIDGFPISLGNSESFILDMTKWMLSPFQFKVRAISTDNIASRWTTSNISAFVEDAVAPAAPADFVASSGYGQISFAWTPPDDIDLAGYVIYKATSISGDDASVYSKVALVSNVSIPETPGESWFFNIKAFDLSGNLSDYALSDWDFALSAFEGTGQILTNADWEAGDVATDSVQDWEYYEYIPSGTPTFDYEATGGIFNSKCVSASAPSSGDEGTVSMIWPNPISAIKVPGVPGAAYALSVYIKQTGAIDVEPLIYLGSHDGSINTNFGGEATEVLLKIDELADDWKRYTQVSVWNGTYDYVAVQIALSAVYDGGACSAKMDRPQLEVGLASSEWGLYAAQVGDTSGTIGLRLDTTSILGDSIAINGSGEFASDLVFADDNTYDVGSDTVRVKDVFVGGDVDIKGDIILQRGGSEYTPGGQPIWFSNPVEIDSFDLDSFSTVATNTKIENTDWQTAIPTDAKRLIIKLRVRDSGSFANNCWFGLYPSSSATIIELESRPGGRANDFFDSVQGEVNCINGDVWYQCLASGTNTLDVKMWCMGYYV